MRGLYLHVPFCYQKCHYCNFVISTRQSHDARKPFFDALSNEIAHASAKYGALLFDTFYLGGGTPSLLEVAELSGMLQRIKSKFKFQEPFEFTLEANPKDVTSEKASAWRELGINRISLGVQAFQDSLLKALGRDHCAMDIEKSVSKLRESGFANISFDLICRLPNQSPQDFTESVEKSLELNPAQITIYDLEVHDKTVFGFQQKKGALILPDEVRHIEMLDLAERMIEDSGLKRYEISNYAKPGFESQHNLIYWNNKEYLGLGPGAFSYLNHERYQIAKDVPGYIRKSLNQDFAPFEYDLISEDQEEIESLLTGLRLARGFDLSRAPGLRSKLASKLSDFSEEGFIESSKDRISLTKRGRRLYESFIVRLLEASNKEE